MKSNLIKIFVFILLWQKVIYFLIYSPAYVINKVEQKMKEIDYSLSIQWFLLKTAYERYQGCCERFKGRSYAINSNMKYNH